MVRPTLLPGERRQASKGSYPDSEGRGPSQCAQENGECVTSRGVTPQETTGAREALHREEGRVRRLTRRRERARARTPLDRGGDGPDVHPAAVSLHQSEN